MAMDIERMILECGEPFQVKVTSLLGMFMIEPLICCSEANEDWESYVVFPSTCAKAIQQFTMGE